MAFASPDGERARAAAARRNVPVSHPNYESLIYDPKMISSSSPAQRIAL